MRTLLKFWHASELMPHFVGATVASIVLGVVLFRVLWRRGGRLRTLCAGLVVSTSTALVCVTALEAYFAVGYVKSDGYGATLAGLRWFEEHWNPINSLGYRDREHDWHGSQTLLVVGDSFIAGHGVDDIDQRLSGVLAQRLGPDWNVAIVAQCGWGPRRQAEALVALGQRPDRLVLSYYINDIESAARAHGNDPPTNLLRPPPEVARGLIEGSHLVNWFYWRIVRGRFGRVYWDWLTKAYESEEVVATHMDDLQRFIDFAAESGAQLDVLVWPNLDYLVESRKYTDRIVHLLRERKVEVLDLGEHFVDRKSAELVVNKMDGHPNPRTHAEVAELLLQKWQL